MIKSVTIAVLASAAALAVIPSATFAAEANQQVQAGASAVVASSAAAATIGKMLYGPDGRRIGRTDPRRQAGSRACFDPVGCQWQAQHEPDQEGTQSPLIPPIPLQSAEIARAARKRRPFFLFCYDLA
jgi:hypothetical protein